MTEDLPLYPLPLGSSLTLSWVELRHQKLLGSRWRTVMTRDPEAGFFGVLLWFEALRQDPAGTLPDDDGELAMLAGLGVDEGRWRRVRAGQPDAGALYGWVRCQVAAGEDEPAIVRLMHATVTEVALVAWGYAEKSRQGRAEQTRGRKIRRVMAAMRRTALRARAARSAVLAEAVLDWLEGRGLAIRPVHVEEALAELTAGGKVVKGVEFGAR